MPTHSCQENGKPGYKWGGKGKCYTYTKGNKASQATAKKKADAQGRAAYAAGYKGEGEDEVSKIVDSRIKKFVSEQNEK